MDSREPPSAPSKIETFLNSPSGADNSTRLVDRLLSLLERRQRDGKIQICISQPENFQTALELLERDSFGLDVNIEITEQSDCPSDSNRMLQCGISPLLDSSLESPISEILTEKAGRRPTDHLEGQNVSFKKQSELGLPLTVQATADDENLGARLFAVRNLISSEAQELVCLVSAQHHQSEQTREQEWRTQVDDLQRQLAEAREENQDLRSELAALKATNTSSHQELLPTNQRQSGF